MYIYTYGFSRIIFDKTDIESMGVNYFDFGALSSTNSNNSPLTKTFLEFRADSFILGLNSFKIPKTQLSFAFKSVFDSTTFVTVNNFTKVAFHYWGFRMRNCPDLFPFYNIPDMLCYDICEIGRYGNDTDKFCQPCKYTCS